jgi:hypothetical protein
MKASNPTLLIAVSANCGVARPAGTKDIRFVGGRSRLSPPGSVIGIDAIVT